MSREIKFRAKPLGWQDGDEWEYGSYVDGKSLGHWIVNFIGFEFTNNENKTLIDIDTLGQFPGLKDKNKADIYEGDIIIISEVLDLQNFITDVYYADSAFRFRHTDNSGSVLPRLTKRVEGYSHIRDVEIIGNIYENPELLENEK